MYIIFDCKIILSTKYDEIYSITWKTSRIRKCGRIISNYRNASKDKTEIDGRNNLNRKKETNPLCKVLYFYIFCNIDAHILNIITHRYIKFARVSSVVQFALLYRLHGGTRTCTPTLTSPVKTSITITNNSRVSRSIRQPLVHLVIDSRCS